MVYAKNEFELPWLIRLGRVYDENQIGQRHEQSYRLALRRNQNWNIMTYLTKCSMREIGQDNDVTDHISAVYAKNNTPLLWPIESGVDYE